jgi:hypothetical protein
MRSNTWLWDMRGNAYSQEGEDGVIAAALDVLPVRSRLVVEFGAHDGLTNSNSRRLIMEDGCRALLIEADPARYSALAALYDRNEYSRTRGVKTCNYTVGTDAATGLDAIMAGMYPGEQPDLVVIDIDGLDYQVWEAMETTRPALVMVEFNQTMCDSLDLVQPTDPLSPRIGSSLAAMVRLGKAKGYELIACLPWNALFCQADLFPLYEIADNSIAAMRTYRGMVAYRFWSYDGQELRYGAKRSPWYQA